MGVGAIGGGSSWQRNVNQNNDVEQNDDVNDDNNVEQEGDNEGDNGGGGNPAVASHRGISSFEPSPGSSSASGVSGVSGSAPKGQVGDWINQALAAMKAAGIDTSRINPQDIATIIQHESGGNPNAVNNWDSNAAAGHPSKGLMQTIQSTFDSYALSGHNNIMNPVDNIIAGVRYAMSRYGGVGTVPGVQAVHNGGVYVGY